MVYNCPGQLLYRLQRDCLLCLCPLNEKPRIFGLCADCLAAMPKSTPTCSCCGLPLSTQNPHCGECLTRPKAFDRTVFCADFNPYVQQLVVQLKQHDNARCRLLADWLAQTLKHEEDLELDYLIPVPMHWMRDLWRGNNHSLLLCKRVSRLSHIPYKANLVRKTRNTLPQHSLNAKQRRRNVKAAFECHKPLAGLRIGIVDDVMTTGSTLHAIAQALKKAGAAEVVALVIARA